MPIHQLLSVGRDPTLLSVRNAVLRRAGYQLSVAHSTNSALQMVVSGDFDLLVLCHSIPRDEAERLVKAIRAEGRNVKVLYIRRDEEAISADLTIQSLDGPDALVESVKALLVN